MVFLPEEYQEERIDVRYYISVMWGFLHKYRSIIVGVIFFTIFTEGIDFADNFFFKYLVDNAELVMGGSLDPALFGKIVVLTLLLYLGIRLIGAFIWHGKMSLINHLSSNLMRDVEQKGFWHIITLSYRFHLNKKTGSLISQFTRGVNKIESFVDAIVFNFIPVFFRLVFSIGVIFYFDPMSALILFLMSLMFIIVGVYITNKQRIPQAIANYREDMLKQNINDVFLNIDTVKYFAKEKRTFNHFVNFSQRLKEARLDFWRYFSWHTSVQFAILGVGLTAMLYVSFTRFMVGALSLGSVALIYAAVWKLIPPLFGLIYGYRELIRSSVDMSGLFGILKEENDVKDEEGAQPLKVSDGRIEFKNVSFAYPTETTEEREAVLKDCTILIKKNMKVALVGPSGSGKSTIVKLLYRLFDLNEGEIFIDGQDISTVTQQSLRENMSIVPQEPILFDNTLFFNIAYGKPNASKAEVWRAIKFAHLDKFIERLPQKEKTFVGERGVKLSGGEKQRVSIARAILANKKILVLDEATSALDSGTEREIQRDLEKLMRGRTSIIIAHRLSTIMKADMIVVLSRGKVVEMGTHEELRDKQGGLYKKLWRLQQGGELKG